VAAALFGDELIDEHKDKQQRLAHEDEEQDTKEIEEFLFLFDALQEEHLSASGDSYDSPFVSSSPSADEPHPHPYPHYPSNFYHQHHHHHQQQPELQVQQQQQQPLLPFPHVPSFSSSLVSSIPVVSTSGVQVPVDAAAKREYRKRSIERWMRKRERRRWIKGATYSRRSEVAVRRPRDNGKFVKSNVRFLTMTELEQQAQL
jgi:hypothetical protein